MPRDRPGDGRPDEEALAQDPQAESRAVEGSARARGGAGILLHVIRRSHEDHRARDDPARRVRQHDLGAPAHRRGPGRPRRDLHGRRRRSRPTSTRPSRRSCSARIRCRSSAQRLARRLSRLARLGRRDARQLGDRHRAVGHVRQGASAGRSAEAARRPRAGSHPHLQHLRRLPIHPRRPRAGGRQLACRRDRAGPYEDLEGFPAPRRRAGAVAARAGHHRHEDLAVRHRGRASGGWTSRRRARRRRSSRSARSARRSATGWTSWSSSTRSGACRWRRRSPSARAEFDTYWYEDPIRLDNIGDLAELRHALARPGSAPRETLADTQALPRVPARPARPASSCSTCPGAAGSPRRARSPAWPRPGTRRSRRTTAPARSSTRRPATSRCTRRNALIQESVRAFYTGWYRELVTALPEIRNGQVQASTLPGLGLERRRTSPNARTQSAGSRRSDGFNT